MIPFWKIRRELARVANQIIQLPASIAAFPSRRREPARRAAYERDFDQVTQLRSGKVPFGKKPAIYLIYQPKGVVQSSLATLDWLVAHGYSPIVVSNCPVDSADQQKVLERSSQLLQRPNFGYDFGGYRDGIKMIHRQKIEPERVIIMNDSVWMPMVPDLMGRLEDRTDADILGLLEAEKIIHDRKGGQPSGLTNIESYFFLLNDRAWQSVAFQEFWNKYEMTDSKPRTIKIGEIGFSRQMFQAGLRIGALTSRTLFLERIKEQDDQFIATTLKYASYDANDLRRKGDEIRAMSMDDPAWRECALDHIRQCVNRKGFNTSFLYANDKVFGTLFIKKNRELIFSEMRRTYLCAIKDGAVAPPDDVTLAEISELVEKTTT